MSIEFLDTDYEKVSYLCNILTDRATGRTASQSEYEQLRYELLSNSQLASLLPQWLKLHRHLDSFWSFIQPKFKSYAERKAFIAQEFSPVLDHLEFGEQAIAPPQQPSKQIQQPKSPIIPQPVQQITPEIGPLQTAPKKDIKKKVFVVHGRDSRLRDDFFSFLRSLELQPIEWSEAIKLTGKPTPFTGEILDSAFKNAQAVIVLLSPDDEVRLSPELWKDREDEKEKKIRLQARPNVLFEAGMAFGTHHDRTLLVEVGQVKAFSDVAGRHVVRLSNSADKRNEIANRLDTAGCDVSKGGNDWLTIGDFEVQRGNAEFIEESQEESSVKWVDLQYPKDSGLISDLARQGYRVKWCSEKQLARCLDIEGWVLATQTSQSGRKEVLKVKDRPYNQTLIMKKEA